MVEQWSSTSFGAFFTRSTAWHISLKGPTVVLVKDGRTSVAGLIDPEPLTVQPGHIWSQVTFCPSGGIPIVVDGIPNAQAAEMLSQVQGERTKQFSLVERLKKTRKFDKFVEQIETWVRMADAMFKTYDDAKWWIPEEEIQRLLESKNNAIDDHVEFKKLSEDSEVIAHLKTMKESARSGVDFFKSRIRSKVENYNEKHFKRELEEMNDFFNTVEKSPLTDEQKKSVVCFDNRVLTIASAGSGKTSTMIARAGYAIKKKIVQPESILMLAFNDNAAKELQARADERLKEFGIKPGTVKASTFHAFGRSVIGAVNRRAPPLAAWVGDDKQEHAHLAALVDTLKDQDTDFRMKWDLFRLVFGRDVPVVDEGNTKPLLKKDKLKPGRYRTLNGEFVRSLGERMIADWLFYNGVKYDYERNYEHDTATPTRRQYAPDFYYPDVKLYHEHWALDNKNQPPPEFKGYVEGMVWKRNLHKEKGTSLIETTTAGLRNGAALLTLKHALESRGITLDPNPHRPVKGEEPIKDERLIKLFRTFLGHVKSNGYTDVQLFTRLKESGAGAFQLRYDMFLQLFVKVRAAWEKSLQDARCIDFDDMLIQSAQFIEEGKWTSPYKLVMVDEFQDSSNSRARLISALLKKPGMFLFAVGDDWQSINRYAGSDLSVMSEFEERFGKGHKVELARTFRCSPNICKVSSYFVGKNPSQIKKTVTSTNPNFSPTIDVRLVKREEDLQGATERYLDNLCADIKAGRIPLPGKGKIKVYALGRYGTDSQYLPENYADKYKDTMDLQYVTVHSSKGLEADYVIMPRMARRYYSFPSSFSDDPVLALAMPKPEKYELAEERRLFYVALTRARRSVTIFAEEANTSPFVTELMHDFKLSPVDGFGQPLVLEICPKCNKGTLAQVKTFSFKGCSNYPDCDHTQQLPAQSKK
jgi:DNA helicase-4